MFWLNIFHFWLSLLHNMHLQKFNITNLAAIDSLLENASNYVGLIYRIEIGTVTVSRS
jgi:hypothetical protein